MTTSIIEGIGDEVLASVAILVLIAVLSLAWYSTRARPFSSSGTGYLVQIEERNPTSRRVLQVISLDQRPTSNGNTNEVQSSLTSASADVATSASANDAAAPENGPISASTNDLPSANVTPPKTDENLVEERALINDEATLERILDNEIADDVANSQTKTVKIKFLDETFRFTSFKPTETVGEFKRQNFQEETGRGQIVRLIFRGQLLRDDLKTLSSYGVQEDSVLHCYLANPPESQQQNQPDSNRSNVPSTNFSIGNYLYVVFGLNFCVLWIVCLLFWHHISVTALVYLVFCTLTYALFLYHHHTSSARRQANSSSTGSVAN